MKHKTRIHSFRSVMTHCESLNPSTTKAEKPRAQSEQRSPHRAEGHAHSHGRGAEIKRARISSYLLLSCILTTLNSQSFSSLAADQSGAFPISGTLQTGGTPTGLYATVTPFEHANVERTHVHPADFGGAITGQDHNIVNQRPYEGSHSTPYNIVTRDEGELFLIGGTGGEDPASTGPYIVKFDTQDGSVLWNTKLREMRELNEFMWPGVVTAHGNGFIYAVAGAFLWKLDPETGAVLGEAALPAPVGSDRADVAYNGFTVLNDGTIIAKSFGRPAGCQAQGTDVIERCSDEQQPPSLLVAVHPGTLEILDSHQLDEPSGGRITSTVFESVTYLYVPGDTNIQRFIWTQEELNLDPIWEVADYTKPGQTPASAPVIMGDWVVFQTNYGISTAPLTVWAISQGDASRRLSVDPFGLGRTGRSSIPSALSVDPANKRIFAMDALAMKVGAIDLVEDAELQIRWVVDQMTFSHTSLVGPEDERVLATTAIENFAPSIDGSFSYDERVVWRLADSGKVLAESELLGPMAPGVPIAPGFFGVWYYLGADGSVTELRVEEAPSPVDPVEIRTTPNGVDFVRTPDARFENLSDWPYAYEYVEIDGLRQAYAEAGPTDGPVVLLLHGQPSWSYLYRKMIPILASAGYRVIAMDHLGCGRSDKPVNIDEYTYLGHNDRLERFITGLGLEDIHLFVQDWGSLIGLRVAGLHPEWFASIAVGNGALPILPPGQEVFPTVENPNEILDLAPFYALIPDQQIPFYDGCERLLEREGASYFGDWMEFAMKSSQFRASGTLEALTWFPLSEDVEAAYDAPFPSRDYMAGIRKFPSLVNETPGTTTQAWLGLRSFEKPFLTIWAANDPGQMGGCDAAQIFIDNVPGAEGQPHTRLPEASHFLQDDQGAEIAHRLVAFYNANGIGSDPISERVGFEILQFRSPSEIIVWTNRDMKEEEFDAIDLPLGWFKNQPRESDPTSARFLRSPGATEDGPLQEAELFGHTWQQNATVIETGIGVDEQGLLEATRVEKHHELTYAAGTPMYILISPLGEEYIRVSRDANRAEEDPTLPDNWRLVEHIPTQDLVVQLPNPTLNIRADNEDSFQGPLTALSDSQEIETTPFLDRVINDNDVQFYSDIWYGEGEPNSNQPQYLDVYQPVSPVLPDLRPTLVYIHGGAFVTGDKGDQPAPLYSREFAERGYTVFSINYTTDGSVVSAVQDAAQAIRWVRENANVYGVDPSRLIVGGHSAGSVTALNVATLEAGNIGGPDTEVAGVLVAAGAVLVESNTLESDDPPLLIINGVEDVLAPVENSRSLVASLDTLGSAYSYSYMEIEGAGHSFIPGNVLGVPPPGFAGSPQDQFQGWHNTEVQGKTVDRHCFEFFFEHLNLVRLVEASPRSLEPRYRVSENRNTFHLSIQHDRRLEYSILSSADLTTWHPLAEQPVHIGTRLETTVNMIELQTYYQWNLSHEYTEVTAGDYDGF